VTLIDTAPSYSQSEERIGRILRNRRHEFVLSTKGGYGAPKATGCACARWGLISAAICTSWRCDSARSPPESVRP
jgi:aryl-alcohol dehydrogenase-like predicted oxidoreductase